ncbi:M23 family metallopeptidase, partial [Nocardia zapadnayensis]
MCKWFCGENGESQGKPCHSCDCKTHTGNGVVGAPGDINGDEMYTSYGHLSSVDVKPGDTVEAGTKLGESGNTGNSEGPHLHFGVFLNSAEPSGAM